MRKSTREIKKPELFRFEESTNKSRKNYEEDDNASPDTDEEEDLFNEEPPTSSRSKKAQVLPKKSVMTAGSSLFGKLLWG